jgi:transcriptional antiterminator NusG
VGPGSKPVPLSDEEVERMGVETIRMADLDFAIGDRVSIKSGAMEGFLGTVTGIDNERRKVNVTVSMFGRETPAEVDCSQVERAID